MKESIYFVALGGGQRVGASCYYLRLGKDNILLDCGTGYDSGLQYNPNLQVIVRPPFMESMNQLNRVFISHAHADHIGYMPELMKMSPNATFYMTETTVMFTKYQIYDRRYQVNKNTKAKKTNREEQRLLIEPLMNNISTVSYYKRYDYGNYHVTYFPAGHMPGAAMIYIEYGTKKILYTGDISITNTPLTSGYRIPEGLNPDILIMCGLHAKHPSSVRNENVLEYFAKRITSLLYRKKSIYCTVKQLSKGIEFLKYLNIYLKQEELTCYKILLTEKIIEVVKRMESLGIPVMEANNYTYERGKFETPHIVIGSDRDIIPKEYEILNVDFSLHVDFSDIRDFIKKINPSTAIMVHCAEDTRDENYTIEQDIMSDGDCHTQFIFAEEKEIYEL